MISQGIIRVYLKLFVGLMAKTKTKLVRIYGRLKRHFGHLGWWPGSSEFEIMVGAILTQNTAWSNVEKAIENLKSARVLSFEGFLSINKKKLARLIRPSGYFNEKAEKLKTFVKFLKKGFGGDLEKMKSVCLKAMREELLQVKGIGPETADSILLYALSKRVFVVDSYTRRIFSRIGLSDAGARYDEIQTFFMTNLPADLELYNDFHAQIVMLGKEICKKKEPLCNLCPVSCFCEFDKKRLIRRN